MEATRVSEKPRSIAAILEARSEGAPYRSSTATNIKNTPLPTGFSTYDVGSFRQLAVLEWIFLYGMERTRMELGLTPTTIPWSLFETYFVLLDTDRAQSGSHDVVVVDCV